MRKKQQDLACRERIAPNGVLVRSKDTCILSEAIGDCEEEGNVLRDSENLVGTTVSASIELGLGKVDFSYLGRTHQYVFDSEGVPFGVEPGGESEERV